MNKEHKPYAHLIASNLARLPSDLFLNCDLTKDQLNCWSAMRDKTYLESIYLFTLLSGLNDPLPELIDKGIIDEREKQMIILKSNFYMRFWELVQTTEPHVRSAWLDTGLSYPYENAGLYSAAWLFVNVLRHLVDGKFKESLNAYFNCSAKDIGLLAADTLKKVKHPQKKNQARVFAQRLTQDQDAVIYLLTFCDCIAKQDLAVKMRLKAFNVASGELAEHLEAASKQKRDTRQSRKLRSYTWDKGVLKFGLPQGGTYA